jgi:Domain of unknown function (DUF4437)
MAREHVEILHTPDMPYGDLPADGWPAGVRCKTLSRDSENGALTGIVSLPGGYRRPEGHVATASEFIVLSGSLRIGDRICEKGFYEYMPAGATHDPWTVDDGCEFVLLATEGAPNFVPEAGTDGADGRVRHDTERMNWSLTPIPGPPPGLFLKVLRQVEETGAAVFICGIVPRYDYPLIEYHDCSEEAFQLEGDIRMGTSGLMRPGSYFWRPPYITHGPFYSRAGMVALITIDSPLINHYVDDPRRSMEENRAEALAQGPPPDYLQEPAAAPV